MGAGNRVAKPAVRASVNPARLLSAKDAKGRADLSGRPRPTKDAKRNTDNTKTAGAGPTQLATAKGLEPAGVQALFFCFIVSRETDLRIRGAGRRAQTSGGVRTP